MKREIGISIYPDHSDPKKDQEYLTLAASLGYKRLFMSMLEVTEGKEKVQQKFSEIIYFAKQLGFETILDVSPRIFNELNISYDDLTFFHELGADGIRLDQGFDGNKESLISYNHYQLAIELNMSNDVAYLENIVSYQPNLPFLYGCHNFYPQEGTALEFDFFMKCSERFKKFGLKTAAFVTSQTATMGPWEVSDGLPTLELCRHLPMELQARILFATNVIDTVIIGNAYASEEELREMAAIDRYKLTIGVVATHNWNELETKIVEDMNHYRRGDSNALVVRSTQVRVMYKQEDNPPQDNTHLFERGAILIGNDTFGQYKNELQIALTPHEDTRKNQVAYIPKEEQILLDFMKPWTKFCLMPKKEVVTKVGSSKK
ncbi:DUF871 domain-containing protein [Enterococcus bulliens]